MPTLPLVNRIQKAYHRRICPYWFISFPKSGRTWTKTIVENYLIQLYGLPPFTFEENTPWIMQGPMRHVPRLTYVHPHCRDTTPQTTQNFMRRLANKKIIVMVRDPREVVYTYFFRLRKRMKDPKALSLSLAEFVRDEELGISRIIDFTNTWYSAESQFRDFLFLRLEDVQANPLEKIAQFLTFLDIPVKEDLLSQVINDTHDMTTRKIEDPEYALTKDDLDFLDQAMCKINPEIGYQANGCGVDHNW